MKFHLISDNTDTYMGMRLAGIEGTIAHEKDEVRAAVDKAIADKSIGIVLITERLVKMCDDYIFDIKLHRKSPLILEIPDRHGTSTITAAISRYVEDAIGMKI
jgi:V/A-type H+-transporting ATPase subunit F